MDPGSLLAIHKLEAGCVIPAAITKAHIQHLQLSNILLPQNPKWMFLVRRYFSHHHSEIQSIYFHVMAPPLPRASESSTGPPRSAARLGQESTENYVGGFCGHSCTQFIGQNSATWSHLNARATEKAYYGEMLLRRKKKRVLWPHRNLYRTGVP